MKLLDGSVRSFLNFMQILDILFCVFLCVCLRSFFCDNSCIRCQIGENDDLARCALCVLILLDKLFLNIHWKIYLFSRQ